MTVALIDDQQLSSVLRGHSAGPLRSAELYTTGYWYVRLCQAVVGAAVRPGVLSGPFLDLPVHLRDRATAAVIELPPSIGLISLRQLAPIVGRLRRSHDLNVLGMEALAAASQLEATVYLSASSPRLETALAAEGRPVMVAT